MKKFGFLILAVSITALLSNCKRDEIDFDKFSDRIAVDRQIAIPLIYGQVEVDDLLDQFESSLLFINGDTVEIVFGYDSIKFVEDKDLIHSDTLEVRDSIDFENQELKIETASIHYKFKNYFPIGLRCEIILYDGITNTVLDIISFNPENRSFIMPSPVDSNGDVITSEVIEYSDNVNLDEQTLENLMHVATHFIFNIELVINDSESVNSVKIPSTSTLDFNFGLEAEGTYTSN